MQFFSATTRFNAFSSRVRPQKAMSNQERTRRLIANPASATLSWPDTLIAFKIDRRTKTAKSGWRNNSYDLPKEICAPFTSGTATGVFTSRFQGRAGTGHAIERQDAEAASEGRAARGSTAGSPACKSAPRVDPGPLYHFNVLSRRSALRPHAE